MSDESDVPRGRFKRLGKLVGMTTRVGAGLVVGGARRLLGGEVDPQLAAAQKVLQTLGDLKGAAMKAGQTLSLFSDQLPPEAQKVLGKLFAQAPTLPFPDIAAVLEAQLGRPLAEAFRSFEEVPLAAASLGQVHGAVLHSGEEVAVKVQYPGVEAALRDDFKNAGALVKTMGLAHSLFDTREYFEEIEREIVAELDYRRELQALERFRGYLARFPDVVVPRAHPELSTGKVLVLERLRGITLQAYVESAASRAPDERFALGERLVRAVYGPFLFHRVVHGDTHPGNYIVLEDGRLGVLDYGCVKALSERFWRVNLETLRQGLTGERQPMVPLLKEAGFEISLSDDRAQALLSDLLAVVELPLIGPYDFGGDTLVKEMFALKSRHPIDSLKVRPPPEALLFFRALGGLRKNLSNLRAAGDFRPFFRQALTELGVLAPPANARGGPATQPGGPAVR